jgi:hypothetical protein
VVPIGDPVCQQVAVLLAKVRDCHQRLGPAPQFAVNLAALRADSGPGVFIKWAASWLHALIAASHLICTEQTAQRSHGGRDGNEDNRRARR